MKLLICRVSDDGVVLRSSELIQSLINAGNKFVVATPRESAFQDLINMGCRHIEIGIQPRGMNPIADAKLYFKYKHILRNESPELVLLYTTKPNIYCGIACRRMKIPVIMNITGMGSALGNRGLLQRIMVTLYKCACNGNNIKSVLFQNENSLEFFKKHGIGNSDKFARIPGSGVDLSKYPLQPFPNSKTVDFLFVARVIKQKGIDQYLEAAKKVRKKHPEAIFHVLGECDGNYNELIEEESRKGNIIYHGRVCNIEDYQRMSQCTIHPSYYPEGISNVILEAAASGRPVITTDHPGCREGVDDGVTGFIVPVKDSEELKKAIEKFLLMSVEERKEMGLRGRRKMEWEFDQKIVTRTYLDMING